MQISLGHLLTVGLAALAFAVAWGEWKAGMVAQDQRIAAEASARQALESRIIEELLKASNARREQESRIRYVEQQAARTDERFTLILSSLSELKAQFAKEQ